jgi:titin
MTVLPPSIVYARIGEVPLQVNVSSVIPTIIPDNGGRKVKLSWLVPTPYTYVPYAYAIKYVLLEPADGNPSSPFPSPGSVPDASWNILPASSYTTVPDTARTAAEGGANVGVMTIVSGITNGKNYSFKVAAINAVGRGAYSNALPVAVIPGSVPSILTVTTEFAYTINTTTGGNVTLYWTLPNKNGYAITTYRVRRRTNPSDAWTTVEIAIPPGVTDTHPYRTLTVTSLVNGNAYEFQISSRNALGWSEFSDTLYATPRKVPDPIMAVTVSALNQGLRVNWSTVEVSDGGYPITGYRVQYLPVTTSTPTDAWRSINIDGIYNSTTDINGLVNGITHRVRVLQFNAIGSSVPETSAVVTGVPGVVALAPISLFISLGNARVTVYWVPPPSSGTNDIAYYYVQYKVASAPDSAYQYVMNGNVPKQYTEASLIPNPPGYDSFVARVEGLTNGTQYNVRVSAVTQVGIGAWSDPVQGIPGTVPSKVV